MGRTNKNYKFLKYTILIVVILFIGGYIYFDFTYPVTYPAPNVDIISTPKQIERGKYLANNVSVCLSCHSSRDWTKFSGPIIPGSEGMGGERFENGFPGKFYAGNITPSGIGEWTDGDLLRAITTGVTKGDRALYPIMPYPEYHSLSIEDLYSIIKYIRTLQPVVNEVPVSSVDFPMNFIIETLPPEAYTPLTDVNDSNSNEYGKYLVTIAACQSCHTPLENGKFNKVLQFSGGTEFSIKGEIVKSANITPDIETGIGSWTKEDFVKKFQHNYENTSSAEKKNFNSPMPWTAYSGMTEKDLNAMYDYLKTVPPVHNKVN